MNDYEKFSDEEIVEKVRSIDQELYVIIVERYQSKLLRYAANLIKDEHKAVDVENGDTSDKNQKYVV